MSRPPVHWTVSKHISLIHGLAHGLENANENAQINPGNVKIFFFFFFFFIKYLVIHILFLLPIKIENFTIFLF